VADLDFQNLGETLALETGTRIQLCGHLAIRISGKRVEHALPGRQGRVLFAYLVTHRRRPLSRAALIEALWPAGQPGAPETALSALLAKLRRVVGSRAIVGTHDVRLLLPVDAWIDVEAAAEALHRAESAVSLGNWTAAWGPSRVALHIGMRTFLAGYEAPWIDESRHALEDLLLRAYECVATCGLHLGGPELASADRSARALIKLAPLRESGYQLLMQVLAGQGNIAEALSTYENLRLRVRDELGANPGPATQALQMRLLRGSHR
jgi:SARP family transcriptional regulator, regulator of embCAB operon